jgi:hypothetical protein
MTYVTVDVDAGDIIEQLSDADIRHEYNERGLGPDASSDDVEVLTKIWLHDREGRKDEAYALMREYVLDKLNKVI